MVSEETLLVVYIGSLPALGPNSLLTWAPSSSRGPMVFKGTRLLVIQGPLLALGVHWLLVGPSRPRGTMVSKGALPVLDLEASIR